MASAQTIPYPDTLPDRIGISEFFEVLLRKINAAEGGEKVKG